MSSLIHIVRCRTQYFYFLVKTSHFNYVQITSIWYHHFYSLQPIGVFALNCSTYNFFKFFFTLTLCCLKLSAWVEFLIVVLHVATLWPTGLAALCNSQQRCYGGRVRNYIKGLYENSLPSVDNNTILCICITFWCLQWQEFGGNVDKEMERYHYLNSPFVARYARFHPIDWHHKISMRAGLLGCPHKGDCSKGFVRINDDTPCGNVDFHFFCLSDLQSEKIYTSLYLGEYN